jgi:hypothetical protein
LLGVGVLACGLLQYHLGAIALFLGTVAWFRAGESRLSWLWIPFVAVIVIAAIQVLVLSSTGGYQGREVLGAMIGKPSVWPILRFAGFSMVASIVYVGFLGYVTLRFARGQAVPIHFLFFCMAVWGPLLGIGIFQSFPAMRYMPGILPYFMLVLVAGVSYLVTRTVPGRLVTGSSIVHGVFWLVFTALVVNPAAVVVASSNDYRSHPDHKGAAQFVKSQSLQAADIVIAEDSINQTWYLGKVDFRLRHSTGHAVLHNGRAYGMYEGAPYVTNGAELERLFDSNPLVDIYIISSGEPYMMQRLGGIDEVLSSDRVEVVYEGRDGRTRVWKVKR